RVFLNSRFARKNPDKRLFAGKCSRSGWRSLDFSVGESFQPFGKTDVFQIIAFADFCCTPIEDRGRIARAFSDSFSHYNTEMANTETCDGHEDECEEQECK